MIHNNLYPIAKEGWRKIAALFLAFLVCIALDLDGLEFIFFILTLFVIYIYRNPERAVAEYQKGNLVSPVDGVLAYIEEIDDENYKYKIGVYSSYMDVSVLRVPYSAKVLSCKVQRGARLFAGSKLFSKLNENVSITLEDKD